MQLEMPMCIHLNCYKVVNIIKVAQAISKKKQSKQYHKKKLFCNIDCP